MVAGTDFDISDLLSERFQELVLALAARDRQACARIVALVEVKYFTTGVYRAIARALIDFWNAEKALPQPESLAVAASQYGESSIEREAIAECAILLYDTERLPLDKAFIIRQLVAFVQRARSVVAVGKAYQDLRTFDIQELAKELEQIRRLPVILEERSLEVVRDWQLALEPDTRPFYQTGFQVFDRTLRGGAKAGELVCIMAPLKRGKALPDDTPVLTPTGWQRMDALHVGDYVVGVEGTPIKVTAVFPQGHRPAYRVHFNDGADVVADAEHLWATMSLDDQKNRRGYRVRTTAQIAKSLRHGKQLNHKVPVVRPVFPFPHNHYEVQLPIEPYVLGALLGNAGMSQTGLAFTSADEPVVSRLRYNLPAGVELKAKRGQKGQFYISNANGERGPGANPLISALRDLGLFGKLSIEKFIPPVYFTAGAEARVALLQGLMDTDGTVGKGRDGTHVTYCTSSPRLADDVTQLVRSLGGIVRRSLKKAPKFRHKGEVRTGQPAHILSVNLPNYVGPFSLPRKRARVVEKTRRPPKRHIVAVEPLGIDLPMRCIMVDAPDGLFVVKDYIVTHNSLVLANLGRGLMQMGFNVVHYSLELYDRDVLRTYWAALSDAPMRELPNFADRVIATRAAMAEYGVGRCEIRRRPANEFSAGMLEAEVEQLMQELGAPVVPVIDYPALLRPEEDGEEWRVLPMTFDHLRNMGDRLEVPVFAAHQTNVGGFQAEELGPQHFSGATRVGYVVDYCFGFQQNPLDRQVGRGRLVPFLNRTGSPDDVDYLITDAACRCLRETDKDTWMALAAGQVDDPVPKKRGGKLALAGIV